jgi:hypothetical protein
MRCTSFSKGENAPMSKEIWGRREASPKPARAFNGMAAKINDSVDNMIRRVMIMALAPKVNGIFHSRTRTTLTCLLALRIYE